MRWKIAILWIACLWACNPDFDGKVEISGILENPVENEVYVEICGQDSVLKTSIDSEGKFFLKFPLEEGAYIRLSNGKMAIPLYALPGMNLEMKVNLQEVLKGKYDSIALSGEVNKETRILLAYYSHQQFPTSQEMFSLNPQEFRALIDSVVRYNDALIDSFLVADTLPYDDNFIRLFKIQVKVPLAVSYFYYPTYHALISSEDTTVFPKDFNFFDTLLPKNDSVVYNKVYRYKTYEVSYWNNLLTEKLIDVPEEEIISTYFDELKKLKLIRQISEDVAYIFLSQQIQSMSPEEKDVVRKCFPEIAKKTTPITYIEQVLSEK